ncbi:hypothetical protein HU200_049400 [Digitaria exilis]|uniref:riboflavin kinase n=1 Tax=Digitaria exilis TaxID=1010633 RepID=A0A835B4S8_9POAL|nr:hypothetical protein HU200_049400 [Digitaria exilis]
MATASRARMRRGPCWSLGDCCRVRTVGSTKRSDATWRDLEQESKLLSLSIAPATPPRGARATLRPQPANRRSKRPSSSGAGAGAACRFCLPSLAALNSSVLGMAAPKPISRLISHVILDLDGTLLNTDSVVSKVVKPFLVKNGKSWDSKKAHKLVGKTPYEAAAVVLEDYGLPYSTEEFLSMINPMFSEQWCNIKPLPGANRLLKHLRSNGVPTALASNSPRSNIESKISCHQGWKESFSAIVGGDEMEKGKPSPDMPGVTAGKAAGMHVIAVPSVPKKTAEFSTADEVINSLLDIRPENWGLPPFNDWVEGTLPIEPYFIGGPVIKGFGRGSKVLGIPTANLPAENFSDVVSEHTSGEPWLLHDFDEDFYGEELRLAIVGYIRPEANFPSLESLIERIHEDGRIAEKALDLPMYAKYKDTPYLRDPLQQGSTTDGSQAEWNSK